MHHKELNTKVPFCELQAAWKIKHEHNIIEFTAIDYVTQCIIYACMNDVEQNWSKTQRHAID